MPFCRKVNGGSNYKYSNFEDRERRLGNVTMDIVFEPSEKVQNENRKILMISLGKSANTFSPMVARKRSEYPVQQTRNLSGMRNTVI